MLPTPDCDLGELNSIVGQAWGVSEGVTVPQFLAWAEQSGLTAALVRSGPASIEVLSSLCELNESSISALLKIFVCIGLANVTEKGYRWAPLALEYLDPGSIFYVGHALYIDTLTPIPALYLKGAERASAGLRNMDVKARMRMQHSRNFAPAIVAARNSAMGRALHMLDMGCGSGTFAIPLLLDNPRLRMTLVDKADVLNQTRQALDEFNLLDRVTCVPRDMMLNEWDFDPFDAILFGNIFHAHSDDGCSQLALKAHSGLLPGGRIWLHEVLFEEDGHRPLIAALWNANMQAIRNGARQRSKSELVRILASAGFIECGCLRTAGGFSLVSGCKKLIDSDGCHE